jgi:hypothetical protein
MARHAPDDRRRDELAGALARGEISQADYVRALRALDEEQAKVPPPEPTTPTRGRSTCSKTSRGCCTASCGVDDRRACGF